MGYATRIVKGHLVAVKRRNRKTHIVSRRATEQRLIVTFPINLDIFLVVVESKLVLAFISAG